MKHQSKETGSPHSRAFLLFAFVIVIAITVAMTWPAPNIQLHGETYEMTVALYSVCNSRSEDRLADFEKLLETKFDSKSDEPESIREIKIIIADAKSGDWTDAMKSCHHLLDQQTKR